MEGGEHGNAPVDPVWLARARRGDLEAAVLLFDEHRQRITAACRYLDDDEASEVFVTLLEDVTKILTSYDERRPLGPYLFVVAQRRAISLLRRRPNAQISLELLEEMTGHPAGRSEPSEYSDDPARRAVDRLVLERILIDLTDADWVVLRTCTGQMSDDEAADLLETTPAAIRIRRSRFRARLRIDLREGIDGLQRQ